MLLLLLALGIVWRLGALDGRALSRLPWLGSPPSAPSHGGPNIILVLTDDQRWDTLAWMSTVSALPARQFTNAYATTQLCCPSRASILTGQYAHRHGVLTNGGSRGGWARFNPADTLAVRLQAAGYRTALVGKYLNGYLSTEIPPGWDDWFAINSPAAEHSGSYYYEYTINANGTVQRYGSAESDYSTDVLVRHVQEVIRADDPRPFFVLLATVAPHFQSGGGTNAIHAPRHTALFADLKQDHTPSFNEADVSDKPSWISRLPLLDLGAVANPDQHFREQVRSLQAVDEGIARLLADLRDLGKLDNTVVIFMSDNGLMMGEHRINRRKTCPYQECLRVPLVISYPRLTPGRVVDDRVALNIDLAPTLLDLAGLPIDSAIDGRSLLPLLRGEQPAWRTDFLAEAWGQDLPGQPDWAAVHSLGWSYVQHASGDLELYDLQEDPYEVENRAGDSAYAAQQARLASRLSEYLQARAAVARPLPTPRPAEESSPANGEE